MIMDYKKILNKFRQNTKTPHCAAVVLAAGSSSRMGTDKTMLELGGIPVVIRSLMAFEKHELVDEIILVTREEMLQQAADLCHRYELKKLTAVIRGGSTRAESSLAGVSAVGGKEEYIAIHDVAGDSRRCCGKAVCDRAGDYGYPVRRERLSRGSAGYPECGYAARSV